MAGIDEEYSEWFREGLQKMDEDFEAAARNENVTSDTSEFPNPESLSPESPQNSFLELERNLSKSIFSREYRISSPPDTSLFIQSDDKSLDSSYLDSHIINYQSMLEASEESFLTSLLSPVETSRNEFFEAEEHQWNLYERFSPQENYNFEPVTQIKLKNTSFESHSNIFSMIEKPSEFILSQKENNLYSISCSQRDQQKETNSVVKKSKNCRKGQRKFSEVIQMDDSSSIDMATSRAADSPVPEVKVISTGSSGIQGKSHKEEKKKRYECDVCGKDFCSKHYLHQHQRRHTGEKPFNCQMCGKKFARQDVLKSHEVIHTGKKPFVCRICDKKFSRKSTLVNHLQTHSGEKPHICHLCSKPYSHKTSLDYHLLTHTGEKPFKCKFCDMCFRNKSSCNRHQKKKHDGM